MAKSKVISTKLDSGNTQKISTKKSKPKRGKAIKKYSGSCFVLMPFSEPFNTYYKTIIKPAVNNAKLDSFRGDSLFRPSPIMADIWQMIQEAKLLVAEMTTKNANVFYELGLAHSIGKPVVLISESIEDVPFDLQSLRVILYDKNDPSWGNKLKIKITKSINETINSPVESVPQMFRKIVKSQAPIDTGLLSRVSAIERRLSLLDSDKRSYEEGNIFQNIANRTIKELRESFHLISSSKEAEKTVLMALNNKLPKSIIIDLLSESVPPSEVKRLRDKFDI